MAESFRVEGLDEFRRALRRFPKVAKRGAKRGMKRGVLRVQRSARQSAPVDTGRLRASIAYVVRVLANGVRGIVGSAVEYAPFVEFGTRPHWPPIAALETWARRHGTSAFVVARAIAQRGTEARNYLRDALKENASKVARDISREIRRELKRLR
jgi:HK97 gp10 family phage protein